jgi:excisionase family DNA binding protein
MADSLSWLRLFRLRVRLIRRKMTMTMMGSREHSVVLDREAIRPAGPEMPAIREIADFITQIDRLEPTQRPLLVGPNGERIPLPDSLYRLLRMVMEHLERGESVSIVHAAEELTTQQAANLLNVSRPYLIRLADRGDIPCHRVGTHRRISREDVEKYRAQRDSRRRANLRAMTREAEEQGLYDLPEVAVED